MKNRSTRFGAVLLAITLIFTVAGPYLAPHPYDALVGLPYGPAGAGAWLGYDYLGRDIWSRLLFGGWSILWMSVSASLLALVVGATAGLLAGFARHRVDAILIWLTDVLLAFPELILVLLVVSMLGRAPWLIVLTVATAFVPGVLRLTRGVTLGIVDQEYIEAARIMGYSRRRILLREILPNVTTPLLVQFGIMMTWAVTMLSSLSFLGYGVAPPAADWGLMVNENRAGLIIQPLAVIAPVVLLAIFALSANLLAEGLARRTAGITGR